MPSLTKDFEQAQQSARELSERPDNETLLELYSFYKQATVGDATGERPGPFNFEARAKFDMWASRKGMSKDAAMKAYIKLVRHLESR